MKIDDFVNEFKVQTDKAMYCKKHIVKKYMPYKDKVIKCSHIARISMSKVDEEGNVVGFLQNTPSRFLAFTMTLVRDYTDIEIDSDDLAGEYDKLDEVGALEYINAAIPRNETNEFNTILAMTVDDYIMNYRSVVAYLDKMPDLIKGK